MRLLGSERKERGTRGALGLGRRWVSKVASGQTPAFATKLNARDIEVKRHLFKPHVK